MQSRLGHRLFDLGLGPIALAFAGASNPEDQRALDTIAATTGRKNFAEAWLCYRKLDWAVELAADFRHRVGETS